MDKKNEVLEGQIKSLQRKLNILYLITIVGFFIAIIFVLCRTTNKLSNSQMDIIYAKGLIIQDSKGRNRVIIGSPVPDPVEGERSSPESGIVINDTLGVERFGLGLQENGRIVLGLDAPKDKGDNRNRERITLVADENGSAYMRFLNRQTFAVGLLQLDDSDFFSLKFPKMDNNKIKIHQYDFNGEKTFEVKDN